MVVIHAINEKTGAPKDFTFEDYESFVTIYNCQVFQYGTTRIRFLSKTAHQICEGNDLFKIDKIFMHDLDQNVCKQNLASKVSDTLSL